MKTFPGRKLFFHIHAEEEGLLYMGYNVLLNLLDQVAMGSVDAREQITVTK